MTSTRRPARRRRKLRVDQTVAHEVAAAYVDAPDRPEPLTVAAFTQLMAETDELFRWVTWPDRPGAVRVHFTRCPTPYNNAQELIASVTKLRRLEVTTVATDHDRRHPLMGNEVGGGYDRFRAVHDTVGHGRMQLGFDRDGEFAVWLAQERFHSSLARRALGTELHGQHSVRWTTGEFAEPKAMLLAGPLLRRARQESATAAA
jgi:hypothetical protein